MKICVFTVNCCYTPRHKAKTWWGETPHIQICVLCTHWVPPCWLFPFRALSPPDLRCAPGFPGTGRGLASDFSACRRVAVSTSAVDGVATPVRWTGNVYSTRRPILVDRGESSSSSSGNRGSRTSKRRVAWSSPSCCGWNDRSTSRWPDGLMVMLAGEHWKWATRCEAHINGSDGELLKSVKRTSALCPTSQLPKSYFSAQALPLPVSRLSAIVPQGSAPSRTGKAAPWSITSVDVATEKKTHTCAPINLKNDTNTLTFLCWIISSGQKDHQKKDQLLCHTVFYDLWSTLRQKRFCISIDRRSSNIM